MDFYHWWIYEYVLNTQWFIWTMVIIVFGFNFLGPVVVWFRINSKPLPFISKLKKDRNHQKENANTEESQ